MALSDQLAKLSAQAKSLEDSAAATEAKDKAKVVARKAEVEAKLNAAKAEAQAEGKADADDVAAGWQKLRAKVSGDFDTLRENAGKRHATHQAKHADRRADNAECDAEDAIEFAIYALEEAEYYVLAAAEARVEAVDAELNADIKNAE